MNSAQYYCDLFDECIKARNKSISEDLDEVAASLADEKVSTEVWKHIIYRSPDIKDSATRDMVSISIFELLIEVKPIHPLWLDSLHSILLDKEKSWVAINTYKRTSWRDQH